MIEKRYPNIGAIEDLEAFRRHLRDSGITIPSDDEILVGDASPLAQPLLSGPILLGNRFAIHPMEGWDATPDGKPTELTFRRWKNFGRSGAKLIWGGEAVAVRHDGRANPNQLVINEETRNDLARLRQVLIGEHRQATGSTDGLLIGLQLTHSGRFSRPNSKDRIEPRILYRHPLLDRRLKLPADYPLLTDDEIRQLIEDYHRAAKLVQRAGFDFVDIKHCHGYLGHEFLSAHTREGEFGGNFENRTRFLREIVKGINHVAPGLEIGVRLSAFDTVPFQPDPARSKPGQLGPGIPELSRELLPYRWGFGMNVENPLEPDLTEPIQFLSLLRDLNIRLVNLTAGSPYYNPHIQRPALYFAFRWLSTAGKSARRCRTADGCGAALEGTISRYGPGRNRLYLFAGFSAERGASGGARRVGGLCRARAHGVVLSGDAARYHRRAAAGAKACVPDLQRLHYRAAQRSAIGLLSTR